ncbi:AAA family ATPase [Mitsuokella multacida]|uniref:AAA family ATPase n=1 Tax=Mitsuokella multacida TaxID=52226 RepID=UPI003FA1E90D
MEKVQHLYVRNFGPIESCDIEIQRLTVMTGPQASGKSTLAKLIYFFKLAQQYIQSQPLSSVQADKWIRSVFLRTFGDVTELSDDMRIRYDFAEGQCLEVTKGIHPQTHSQTVLFRFSRDFSKSAEKMEAIYIPAGRSMITLLSDQLPVLFTDPNRQLPALDYCTNAYIHQILSLRQFFSNGLDGLLKQEIETTDKKLDLAVLKHMIQLAGKILKARYCYRAGEERLLLDMDEPEKSIKVNFASSGQQETVWALNLLFYYLLEDKPSCIILEEPEAHLSPDSQKYMAEALATFAHAGNQVILTTYSPYVWEEFNNLLYTAEIHLADETRDAIVPSCEILDAAWTKAVCVINGQVVDGMDKGSIGKISII